MIKEEDRLAITVKVIDNESHIVPRGFYYKLPDENIVKAPYFKGIDFIQFKCIFTKLGVFLFL